MMEVIGHLDDQFCWLVCHFVEPKGISSSYFISSVRDKLKTKMHQHYGFEHQILYISHELKCAFMRACVKEYFTFKIQI